jgi:PAS domain S-box-containing protein
MKGSEVWRKLRPNGLILKFLLVFVPIFMLLTSLGFWQLIRYDTRGESEQLAARVGNQAARAASALQRHDALNRPELARDLLAPLNVDRAVVCVELGRTGKDGFPELVPTGLECLENPVSHAVSLPIDSDQEILLTVRFNDEEVNREAALRTNVLFSVLLFALLVAVLSASAGFRLVVARRLRNLNQALHQITVNGRRAPVDPGGADELGQIMRAFNAMIRSEAQREQALEASLQAQRDTQTELERLNEELQVWIRTGESERRFKDFAAASSDWYWEMDPELRFSYFSDRFTEVTGVPNEMLLGKTRRETGIPDVDQQTWQQHLDSLDAHQAFRSFEHPRTQASGEVVWLSISGTPVFDDEGVFQGYRGIGSDITERVRTKELIRAKTVSEQIARTKSEFLANMNHEIRTPINGVLGMTEVLLKTDLDERQRRFANTVRRSGEGLLLVINDILDFSKIEAGKMSLQLAPFDVRELVEDLGEMFADNAQSSGVELLCQVPPQMPTSYRADSGRLRQILTNLVGNALKFTEDGQVVIRAKILRETDERALLRFLGLAISAQLVELMDGQIGVDSTPGQGSTFWFTASFAKDRERAAKLDECSNLIGARVLLVDDNQTNREILVEHLRSWNADPTCAASGLEALKHLRSAADGKRPFALVVLDMQMPGMDGMSLARTIRGDAAIADTHLVILSSIGDSLVIGERDLGTIDAYLSKPVRQAELYNTLGAALGTPDVRLEQQECTPPAETPRFRGRVLLVEDNLVNQEVALELLEPTGLKIDVADGGQQAVDAWTGTHYDLVFMDCQMPGMDGFEAAALIRSRENDDTRPRTPIIALTANAMPGDREACLEAGMDDYMSKPVSEEQLVQTLHRWLESTPDAAGEPGEEGKTPDTGPGAAAESTQVVNDPAAAGENVIDESVIEGFRARERRGRKNVLSRVIGAYLEQSPDLVEQLRKAVKHQDAEALRAAAHTLKSSSAQVGALQLADRCKQLEAAGRAGETADLHEQAEELAALFARVRQALGDELSDCTQQRDTAA